MLFRSGGRGAAGVLNACEWYDPKSGWRTAPRMNQARSHFAATFIASPTDTADVYLAVAGANNGALRSCELFALPTSSDPAGTWMPFDDLNVAGIDRQTAMTFSNLPVVVGGEGTATIEVYQPLRIGDVSFPSTEVGARSDSMPVRITNTWLLPITIKRVALLDGADFILAIDSTAIVIPANSSRTILAWFRPSRPGSITSRVAVDMGIIADTFLLTGTGLSSTVEVITAVMDHGDVQVGSASRICLPLLRNNGSDTTWVDSIVVDPPGSFTIISPIGRTAVPPGEELEVCIEFTPTQRGAVAGSATMHIGPRSYSAAVIGNGIRTVAEIQSTPCDTISAQRGEQITLTAVFENSGDRDVTITDIQLATSIAGIAVLADPTDVPFTISPQEVRVIDVILTIQREGLEQIQISATSNSDTDVEGALCVVVRARNVVPNITSIEVGDLCAGDSVIRTITLTNASALDTIFITDVSVENSSDVSVSTTGPVSITPRTSVTIDVAVTPSAVGIIDANVVVNTTTGSLAIPVIGEALPSTIIDLPELAMFPGEVRSTVVTIDGALAASTSFTLRFAHDLLAIRSVTTHAGSAPVNASSSVQRSSSSTRVNIVWDGTAPTPPVQVDLVMEALRGGDVVTDMAVERNTNDAICVVSDTGRVTVDPNCGQERALVQVTEGAALSIAPSPASDLVTISVASVQRDQLWIRMIDASGSILFSSETINKETTFSVAHLPSGLYAIQLLSPHGLEDSAPLLITK